MSDLIKYGIKDLKMKQSNYGPCGLYCGACGAEDCDGCQSARVDHWVQNCKFRKCAKNKNIDFCCHCDNFPCKELNEFMHDKWPHHWTMEPNMKYIKKYGVEKWLQFQIKEWSCNNCNSEIKWYQKKCRCGKQLNAWDLPA